MAQYIPFEPNVDVNGQTILAIANAIPSFKDVMTDILTRHGLKNIQPEGWYSQKKWLEAFEDIGTRFGANTLFVIGKAIPENAIFPPFIVDIQSALDSINVAYHMNHRNGEIGYYKLVSFDGENKRAIMECKNPYPSEFDRGIITTMARKFRPEDSIKIEVERDTTKESRINGADSCTYIVTWD